MAPLNPNNTARVFYEYQNGINTHEIMLRLGATGTISDADALLADLLSAIGGKFHQATITAVSQSAAGSNIRFPVASDRLGDSFGSGTATKDTDAQEGTFVGKSNTGRLVRLGLFGYKDVISAYRLTSGEDVAVSNAVAALNAAFFAGVAIDGNQAIWKGYMNIKPNDYWVKRARS